MAFAAPLPVLAGANPPPARNVRCQQRPLMSAEPLSRRVALQGLVAAAGASILGAVPAIAVDKSISLEELKSKGANGTMLNGLDYSNQLFANPEEMGKSFLREKKPVVENEAIKKLFLSRKEEEKKYVEMVSKEEEEKARVRALFKKLCKDVEVGCGDYVE